MAYGWSLPSDDAPNIVHTTPSRLTMTYGLGDKLSCLNSLTNKQPDEHIIYNIPSIFIDLESHGNIFL